MRKWLGLACAVALIGALAGCDREERAHEVHLEKGVYAGKPMTKLDDKQIAELQRRANYEQY